MPNFNHRYLTEDIPYGLVVTRFRTIHRYACQYMTLKKTFFLYTCRGIAELCGIDTPNLDEVLAFTSKAIGKKFLTSDGKVAGAPDVGMTRSPQAFGINSIEELIKKLNY